MLRIAKTKNGMVRGIAAADPRITSFKGIPFAAPPVGENRWRAPQPAADWKGIRDCFEFAPISMQDTPGLGTDIYCREWHVDPEIPMDEDCLYLNIWTPAKKADEKLPVLVWYFGGGFQWGYTAEMEFDGERLARHGIVVVSVNYRLAALGFMAHPELSAAQPEGPTNFGLLDQKAGLKWVHENIAGFGGDPEKITIAGQSAGGGSVMNQITCEQNFGIIKGAVIMSGMICNPYAGRTPMNPASIETNEKLGEEFLSFLGVSSIAEARKLDAVTIRNKYGEFAQTHPRFWPVVDGVNYVEDPYKRILAGKYNNIPIMSGNTGDEFHAPIDDCDTPVSMVEYSVKSAFIKRGFDPMHANNYYYRFNPDIPGWDHPGTFHSVDLWFFFDTIAKCWRPFTGRHFDLSRQMSSYFINFIKTGNPNGNDYHGFALPEWKPFDYDCRNEMEFTPDGAVAKIDASPITDKYAAKMGVKKQSFNPYMPSWEYVPDGEPHVFGDRIYVYGSHDKARGTVFCEGDYVCWSAPVTDLSAWRCEGVIYERNADPLNSDGHMCLYAPDVTVGSDGRYYLYYVLDKVSVVSVAVSDTPGGHYSFYGYVHYKDGTKLGDRAGDEPQFDPAVITEGDYTYCYCGFCGFGDKSRTGSKVVKIGPDMLTIEADSKLVVPGSMYSEGTGFEGHAFFEASSIRKFDGRYYFVYSSQVMHELCYAVSDKPDEGFTYGGVVVSNADIGIGTYKPAEKPVAFAANNHGGIELVNGQYYIFYHRHTHGTWYSRQGCAEPITILEDGSIPQVSITSCGLNGGPLSDAEQYSAHIACNIFNDSMDRWAPGNRPKIVQERENGEKCFGYVDDWTPGYTIGFKYFDCKDVQGLYILADGYSNGVIDVRTEIDGEVLGTIQVEFTNVPKRFECKAAIPDGVNAIYLTYREGGVIRLRSFGFVK